MSDQEQNNTGGELEEFAPTPEEALALVRPEALARFLAIKEACKGRRWTDKEFAALYECLTPEGKAKVHGAIIEQEASQKQPAPLAKVAAAKRDRQASTA